MNADCRALEYSPAMLFENGKYVVLVLRGSREYRLDADVAAELSKAG